MASSPLSSSAINESAPLFTQISQPATIPAEISSHGMFVSVMINGQGPFRMQVDTGCSFSMITPEVAAAVEARGIDLEDDDPPVVNGLGDALLVPRVLLDTVTLGGVQFKGVIAGVVPLDLQSKIDSRTLDGLLGYSLFSDVFFALDFPNQDLILSDTWPKNLPPVRAELAIMEHSEVPYIAVKLQGKAFDVMIDTGSNERLHLPPEAVASFRWKTEPRPGLMLAVAGETGREQEGRLSGMLELNGVRQMDPVVTISDGAPTIGVGLLHSFCLIFQETDDKFWLCSDDPGPIPSPPERSVGLSLLAETTGWRVVGIIPTSPAEAAAIREGDLVTRIEGQPAHQWTRDQIQNWIDTHSAVALSLSGPSGERDLTLRVWQLVP